MEVGGSCIGCTMPGFPDKFVPFYRRPPGSKASTTTARLVGGVTRPLRRHTGSELNRESRWERNGGVPSGWPNADFGSRVARQGGHHFYDRPKRESGRSSVPGDPAGRSRTPASS